MLKKLKIVISKQEDGYAGYPIGLEGIIVGDGKTYAEALANTISAIKFHIETFGKKVIKDTRIPKEVFISEAEIKV